MLESTQKFTPFYCININAVLCATQAENITR